MPFPTVKSDPWKKRTIRSARNDALWSAGFWKQLCVKADKEGWDCKFSTECVRMIGDMNQLLYGKR